MTGKLGLLIGFGAGYVLGARAGRERYEQIAAGAQRVWRNPRVQAAAEHARDAAADATEDLREAADEVAGHAQVLVKEKAGEAVEKAKERLHPKHADHTPDSAPAAPGAGSQEQVNLTALGTAPVTPSDTVR